MQFLYGHPPNLMHKVTYFTEWISLYIKLGPHHCEIHLPPLSYLREGAGGSIYPRIKESPMPQGQSHNRPPSIST